MGRSNVKDAKLSGSYIESKLFLLIHQCFMETTNRTAFVGPSRINNDDLFYLNTVVVDGKGSIFMGFLITMVMKYEILLVTLHAKQMMAHCEVWVLAMRVQGPETSIDKNFNESHTYLVRTICIILLFTTVTVVLIVTASQRVTKLRVALKEQVAATTQEEGKGNKGNSCYAEASHDVRASLEGIIGLIDICLT
ncbi:hypothetical protein DCAR_0414878 [Daucus carota subsp. sativus]|uniref:Uncharacterized protein n=1 Tax=Daucus carota subsp. sativus TaxID=79200 RepID=A0A165A2T0_DAUCS|nr:hypothetical protein DCAR_0414878 [Daucus carota subsp. sativus]